MKTIYLVTGAAGFMGTNVCAQLLERGDAVLQKLLITLMSRSAL